MSEKLGFFVPDVPEVVYSCHPEAAAGSCSSLPAAWHGGRVNVTLVFVLNKKLLFILLFFIIFEIIHP